MKILFTQDTDWIKRNPGQQHHIAERLAIKGHEIRVIDYEILWQSESKNELISKKMVFENVSKIFENSNITVIRPRILKIPILDYFSMIFTYNTEIENQIKKFKPDIIISQSILSNYLALRLSKKHNIPIIYQMNDVNSTLIPFRALHPIGRIIESKILKNVNKTIVINELLKEYAINKGAIPEDIHIIRAGIDLERYNPKIDGEKIRKQYNIGSKDTVLFFMGWLYNFSGLKEVVIELAKQKKEFKDIKFLIVGDGDAFDELETIITKYHLQNMVILTGKQPFDKIPEFISAGDICILPAYLNEIMRNIVPIKIYEYMAMKKPVIVTKLPGVIKEFGQNNGVIYVDKPEDVIEKALKIDLEIEGLKARKFVLENDWDKITNEFESVLESL